MELKNANEQLENDLKVARDELSSLTEQTDIAFEHKDITIKYHYYENHIKQHGSKKTTLEELFKVIATEMMDVLINESVIEKTIIKKLLLSDSGKYLDDGQFVKKLLNQYRALNLLKSSWSDSGKNLFWGLTKKGQKVRDDMILIKKC